ncbi:serine kinase/phosphatase [Pseudomonas fluorescens]|uniref:Serine kinase/phosphatase n=1 Tax=Pseudomonas fluorescens TaxID=294 RepID=A0A5E6XTW6_PSEFL|nr:serine kinase/phosphatase [Pseudomonas fluorescens]VVN44426.1 hypothetical protein PS624_05657 [Pseudomonas fluorescens]
MTDSRRPYDAVQPEPIDDNEDRMGSVHELDFDEDEPSAKIGDEIPEREREQLMPRERVREAGMTGASVSDHEPTDDDMSPETTVHEDVGGEEEEAGREKQGEWEVVEAGEDGVGGGNGLDEAELARRHPLDGNR